MNIQIIDNDIVRFDNAFSSEECDMLISAYPNLEKVPGFIYHYEGSGETETAVTGEDLTQRNVGVATIRKQPEWKWLHEKMGMIFIEANKILKEDIIRITEPIKILRYAKGEHFRKWHQDIGRKVTGEPYWRRLTMSVELCEPQEFVGGNLQFLPDAGTNLKPIPKGTATIFKAGRTHRSSTSCTGY